MTRRDLNALVGVGAPDVVRGYIDAPALAEWIAQAPRGPVTPGAHNTIVAQLAWAQSILARPPSRVRRVTPRGGGAPVPFPYGVSPDGALALGVLGGDYEPGDIELPAARPAGAAATGGDALTPRGSYIVTNAERRAAFDACGDMLGRLALVPGSLVAVPTATAPGGYLLALGVGVAIVCAGIGAYAAYSEHIESERIRAAAATQQVRIREEANTAQVVAQNNARLAALAQRLAFAQQTGTLPPPSPIEAQPIVIPPRPNGAPSAPSALSLLWMPGAVLVVAGGAGGYVKYREWKMKRAARTLFGGSAT